MVAAAKTIQINRGDMMAAELRESCSKNPRCDKDADSFVESVCDCRSKE